VVAALPSGRSFEEVITLSGSSTGNPGMVRRHECRLRNNFRVCRVLRGVLLLDIAAGLAWHDKTWLRKGAYSLAALRSRAHPGSRERLR